MARTNWQVFYESSGNVWVADGNITAPNENLNLDRVSTRTKKKLADGSDSFITPETKLIYEDLKFMFLADDGTIATKIAGYITNDYKIKLTDSDGVNYVGYFSSIKQVWITGINPNEYDLEVIFMRIS